MQADKKQSLIERHFITRPGEKLLFATSRHVFTLIGPFVSTIIFSIVTLVLAFFLQNSFQFPVFVLVGVVFFVLLAASTILMKLVVDWYFHFYVITNYKILEVCYKPFFSKDIYVVPLDQMRCVEVTAKTYGFLNTLYDIGDVTIQLDFLTHQDNFTMTNISSPQRTSIMLSDIFNLTIQSRTVNNMDATSVTPLAPYSRKDVSSFSPQNFNPNHWSSPYSTSNMNAIQMKGGEWYDTFL
jgi:hypothetical protein